MMKFFVYTGVPEKTGWESMQALCRILQKRYGVFYANPELAIWIERNAPDTFVVHTLRSPQDLLAIKPDFCLSLGGDGTVLGSATWVAASNVPILGINLGRMGFLTGAEINDLEKLFPALDKGDYVIEQRCLIQLIQPDSYFIEFPFALNDFTILKRDNSAMIAVQVALDGAFLNTYWADGFIVSTPTGSTGYSLSCGGPIVFPNAECFVLTPVAPHHLNVRPIIVNDATEIKISVEARTPNVLMTLDSRHCDLPVGSEIVLRKGQFAINLIQLQGRSFLDNMREKLRWGADSRIKY
jgi:NAD+ kinase